MGKKTGTVNHTHQYLKRADGCWACSGIDSCSHYMPKNMAPLPMGRNSICWACEKPFKLTPANMEDARPKCDKCIDELEAISRFLEDKMPEPTRPTTFTKTAKEIEEKYSKKKEPEPVEEDTREYTEIIDEHGNEIRKYKE